MADKANEFIFTWKIENYSMLPYKNGESIESSLFEVNIYKPVACQLSLYPKGVKGKEGYAACYLHNTDPDLKVKFYFVLQSTETTNAIVSESVVYPNKCTNFGVHNLFQLNEIYAKEHIFLPNDILTLRCHLLPSDDALAELNENSLYFERYFTRKSCMSRSGIHLRHIFSMWSIRSVNLGELVEKSFSSAFVESPVFKLSIQFGETNEFVSIEIRQMCTDFPMTLENGFFVKCKITVISVDKKYQDFNESRHFFPAEPDVWQFPSFIKVSNLTRDKYLFLDDTLHLQCEFTYSTDDNLVYHLDESCMDLTLETKQNDTISRLSTSIEKCYSSGKFCDVELHAGGRTFLAHRLVLGARSSVFSAMFENDMIEKNSGVVNIDDVDTTTLQKMLAFLYDDDELLKEDLSAEDARNLYEAADKYDIESLKQHCRVSLISSLTVASVCDALVFADAHHQDSFLLTAVYNFIGSHTTETFHSSYWRSFMDDNIKLAAEVMHKMLTEKTF